MYEGLSFFVEKQPWNTGWALTIFERHPAGDRDSIAVCTKVEMTTQGLGQAFPSYAPVPFTDATAQNLMDQLWDAGVRPTNGRSQPEQIAALQNHIADLRTIAWKVLKVTP